MSRFLLLPPLTVPGYVTVDNPGRVFSQAAAESGEARLHMRQYSWR